MFTYNKSQQNPSTVSSRVELLNHSLLMKR